MASCISIVHAECACRTHIRVSWATSCYTESVLRELIEEKGARKFDKIAGCCVDSLDICVLVTTKFSAPSPLK